jgi:hypothetical protein
MVSVVDEEVAFAVKAVVVKGRKESEVVGYVVFEVVKLVSVDAGAVTLIPAGVVVPVAIVEPFKALQPDVEGVATVTGS